MYRERNEIKGLSHSRYFHNSSNWSQTRERKKERKRELSLRNIAMKNYLQFFFLTTLFASSFRRAYSIWCIENLRAFMQKSSRYRFSSFLSFLSPIFFRSSSSSISINAQQCTAMVTLGWLFIIWQIQCERQNQKDYVNSAAAFLKLLNALRANDDISFLCR